MLLPRYSVAMIVHQSGLMFVGDDENNDNNKCRQRHIIIVVMYMEWHGIFFSPRECQNLLRLRYMYSLMMEMVLL